MEEEILKVRSEKEFLITVSEENMKRGNVTEGNKNRGSRKKIEGSLHRKYLRMGYAYGKHTALSKKRNARTCYIYPRPG